MILYLSSVLHLFSKLKSSGIFFFRFFSCYWFLGFFEHHHMLLEQRRPGVIPSIQDRSPVQIRVSSLVIPVSHLFCFAREVIQQINWALLKVVLLNTEHCFHSVKYIDPRLRVLIVNIYIH